MHKTLQFQNTLHCMRITDTIRTMMIMDDDDPTDDKTSSEMLHDRKVYN